MNQKLILSIALNFLFLGLNGQNADQFRNAANAALKAFDVPGFSIGIIKDGQVVLNEGFGTRTYGKTAIPHMAQKVDFVTL